MDDRYGYIGIETLLRFCENSKDHAVTPNDFMRMPRKRMDMVYSGTIIIIVPEEDLDSTGRVILESGKWCKAFYSDELPRMKGEWQITDAYPHTVYCSVCHKRFAQTHWTVWEDGTLPRNFCPNCGADMREDERQ